MLSAKVMSRYVVRWGSILTVERQRKTGFAQLTVPVVAGARAATHTGQVSDSAWLEWWWATTASADHKVRIKHKHAAAFASDRIPHNQCC